MKDSERKIVPLSSKEREVFPTVIYRLQTNSVTDQAVIYGTYVAMRSAGYMLAIDFEKDQKNKTNQVVVRTSNEDRQGERAEAALILGLYEATNQKIRSTSGLQKPDELYKQTYDTASTLITEFTSNAELVEEFNKFYGGLRWGSDKERFVKELFVQGTEFDSEFVQEHVQTHHLSSLVYGLDLNIPYDDYGKWDKLSMDDVFKRHPEIDYRRLSGDEFRKSPEGQQLEKAYAKLKGEILERHTSSMNPMITKEGVPVTQSLIPLSKFPIIEALMINEVSIDRPRRKYDMGPSEVTDIILHSDSKKAHESLVLSVITKIPGERPIFFDGPNEFEHKRGVIIDILRAYKTFESDDQKRKLLKEDLLNIIDGFTNGPIIDAVSEENAKWVSRTGNEYGNSTEVGGIKSIITDLITFSLSSDDSDLTTQAEKLIYTYVPNEKMGVILRQDLFSLDRATLALCLIEAIELSSPSSRPEFFQRIGTHLFNSDEVGQKIGRIAKLAIHIKEMRNNPEFILAWNKRKGSEFLSEHKKKAVEDAYDEALKPIEIAEIKLHTLQNEQFIEYAQGLVGQSDQWSQRIFKGFIKNVRLTNYQMRELPADYFSLIALAETDGITEEQRHTILSHIADKFEYLDKEGAKLMVPVILDICRVALGPVDAVRMPTSQTRWGVFSATSLIHKHGKEIFKTATTDQLQTLDLYIKAIRDITIRIAADQFLPDPNKVSPSDLPQWKKEAAENLGEVFGELKKMSEYYGEYLHIEDVKVEPHVYYPWVLQQLGPFWQKMNWEVGPGNSPTSEIRELFRVFEDHVRNRLVLKEEYPEGFDVIETGNLGTLLYEFYNRMVVPHDIKYNGAVWKEGLGFMSMAISHMPQSVFDQLKQKYPNTNFIKYVDTQRTRSNQD